MSNGRKRRDESPMLRLAASRSQTVAPLEQLVYAVDGHWFFLTAEAVDLGPYPSRAAARAAANLLSRRLDGVEDPAERLTLIFELKFGGLTADQPAVRVSAADTRG